jgi:predicted regulator of Ras-like GTPase activity (Roadblock/LC7/MglB family)
MFKLLKKLFSSSGGNAATTTVTPAASATPAIAPRAAATPAPAGRLPEAAPGVECASLSLRAILDRFPSDLKSNVGQLPEADVKVILPVNAIMKQLPAGSVRMSLGSLFRQAPSGTFLKTNVDDKRMVEVPLAEVFKSINVAKLNRRNDQRDAEVPDDVDGLFGADGKSKSVARGNGTPAPAPTSSPKTLRMSGIRPPPQATSLREPALKRPGSASLPEGPAIPLNLNGELALALVEIAAGWQEGIRGELSVLTGDTKVVLPLAEVSAGLQKGKVAFTWEQLRNWLTPPPSNSISIPDSTVLSLPLKIVAPAFVAATGARKRGTGASLNESLPDFFGPAAGRTPAPAPSPEPVAPTPVAEPALPQPTPLASTPAPEPVAEQAPAPLSLAKPASAADGQAAPAAPVVAAGVPRTLCELFNQPGKSGWTPNELVKLTSELPGVLGCVVALNEGLVVAQKLPEGLSADTFAAFMPQIFSRLEKYTAEMQLGDASEVSLVTAGGPVRFYRRGSLYFATLGRMGESLPAGLHLIAAELASQN